MQDNGLWIKVLVSGALPPLLALVPIQAPAALAQDALPSVSDYKLPSPTPSARPQGPVDPDVPVVRRVSPADGAEQPSAQPAPVATTPAATPQQGAGRTSSTTPRAVRRQPQFAPPPAQQAGGYAAPLAAPAAPVTAGPPQSSVAMAPPPPIAAPSPGGWHVHSARERIAESALEFWPWLVGLAFVLGAGLAYLFQSLSSRRNARLAAHVGDYRDIAAAPEPAARPVPPRRPQAAMPESTAPEPASEPGFSDADLDGVLADSGLIARRDLARPAPESKPAPSVPSLAVVVNPLEVTLAARKLSATLLNTALNYELVVTNTGKESIGPLTVGGDMIGAHASLPASAQLELAEQGTEPLHRLETLGPGESRTLTGELRLPLASILPIRNGNTSLFVPLARFRVKALRGDEPLLVVNRTFVIGETQATPGAALKPFRLDLGPRLYSQISQRELALTG